MTELERLIEIASSPLGSQRDPGLTQALLAQFGPLVTELEKMLGRRNGFLAFESALHVFPLGGVRGDDDLESWNAATGWRTSYNGLAADCLFFGEDVFGNQFAIKGGQVVSFDAETAEASVISDSLEGWAAAVLNDYESMTGYPIAHAWQLSNGGLPRGFRLVPKTPFVLGGEYTTKNLRAIVATRGMRWRGELAKKIRDVPDGGAVSISPLE